jgi:hypothetical protein
MSAIDVADSHQTIVSQMPEPQIIQWRRFATEATVIVASILLAFAIDAWWDSRAEEKRELALLLALSDDFTLAARVLESDRNNHLTTANAGEKLINFGESGNVPDADRGDIDLLISAHFWRISYRPPMGTVESVIGSGRIDLLSNQALIAELMNWPAEVARVQQIQLEAREHVYDRIYPYLAARLNLKDLDKVYPKIYEPFPWDQAPTDAFQLVSDQEFLSIIYMHWVLQTNILDELETVEASLTRIRNLIETELTDSV